MQFYLEKESISMASSGWTNRFLQSTRGRVVQLLRQRDRTVSELADALDLTGNAIRAHLSKLERDDLARAVGKRAGVRKPEVVYGLTPEAEQLFPKAYDQLLSVLLDILAERLPADEVRAILEEMAPRIAADHHLQNGSFRERVEGAQEVLETLGGLSELEEHDDRFVIRGCSCPFGAVVDHHPEVCHLAELLLADLIDCTVQQRCRNNGEGAPQCIFEITPDGRS